MVDWVLIWRQFNEVTFINVGLIIFTIFLLRREIDTIIHYLFSLRLVTQQLLLFKSWIFITHRCIHLMNWFKVVASIFETGSVSHEWLINTSTRYFNCLLLPRPIGVTFTISKSFLLSKQIFEIRRNILLIMIVSSLILLYITVILCELRCLLV